MQHTLAQLESIVDKHNSDSLQVLKNDQPWLAGTLPSLTTGYAGIVSTFPSLPISYPPIRGCRTKVPFTSPLAAASQCVSLDPSQQINAVFTVVDGFPPANGDKDVILCVGINFGQGTHYLGGQKLTCPTELVQMRSNLMSAFCHNGQKAPSDFHLVAANFFPWISSKSWGATAKGSIDEAVLLRACGYNDPVTVIADLAKRIKPSHLMFHGVGNCVTILGLEVVRKIGISSHITCIFTGNLAYNTDSNFIVLS